MFCFFFFFLLCKFFDSSMPRRTRVPAVKLGQRGQMYSLIIKSFRIVLQLKMLLLGSCRTQHGQIEAMTRAKSSDGQEVSHV